MHTSIQTAFNIMTATRSNLERIIENHSIEQLNLIPEGFSNNLAWNFGHVVVTQQLLVYGLSGLPLAIEAEYVDKYRKGSRPTGLVSSDEIAMLREKCSETMKTTFEDYEKGIFKTYKQYTTSYGMTLSNADEAIIFNNVHESLHLGTCLDLRKFV